MSEENRAAGRPKMTALITGASGGIGPRLARSFAAHGPDLLLFGADGHDRVLVARSAGKLSSLADELKGQHNVRARVLPADLARPEAPREIYEELWRDRVNVY